MSKAHIDMDFIVYAVASACDGKYWKYKGQEYETKTELNKVLKADGVDASAVTEGKRPEPFHKVKDTVVSYTEGIIEQVEAQHVGHLSGKGNFRYKAATILPYKGNRAKSEKPFHYDGVRQFLVDNYEATLSVGMEADDAIGLAHDPEKDIVVTRDKDLDMIVGKHYNWETCKHYDVSLLEANRNFYAQLCTGDSVDNILGLFGVGKKAAMVSQIRQMEEEQDMYERVLKEYTSRFGSYAHRFLEENAKLLWILQPRRTLVHRVYGWDI